MPIFIFAGRIVCSLGNYGILAEANSNLPSSDPYPFSLSRAEVELSVEFQVSASLDGLRKRKKYTIRSDNPLSSRSWFLQ